MKPPPPPPNVDRLTLTEAVEYLRSRHQITVSRRTVYNWAHKGRKNVKLQSSTKGGVEYTTRSWVDSFIREVDG